MGYKYNKKPELHNSVSRYLESKSTWENRLWRRLESGSWVTELDGQLIAEDDFAIRFPKFNPVHFRSGRENVDNTTNWINK